MSKSGQTICVWMFDGDLFTSLQVAERAQATELEITGRIKDISVAEIPRSSFRTVKQEPSRFQPSARLKPQRNAM